LDIKKEAAFHEAGHAVMAYLATYHGLVAGIDLQDYGSGEIYVGLLKSKCVSAGVPSTAETAKRPEVAMDLGRILVAGLVAEVIAAERDASLTPNPSCALPDHDLLRQQLMIAGLSRKFDRLEVATRTTLEENWSAVEELAEFLFSNKSADMSRIEAIIGPKLSCIN
jgi:hypothetical protein